MYFVKENCNIFCVSKRLTIICSRMQRELVAKEKPHHLRQGDGASCNSCFLSCISLRFRSSDLPFRLETDTSRGLSFHRGSITTRLLIHGIAILLKVKDTFEVSSDGNILGWLVSHFFCGRHDLPTGILFGLLLGIREIAID